MKLVVACSKGWFEPDEAIVKNNDLLFVNKQAELTRANLSAFNPSFVFFPHWSWIVEREIFENFECILFHTAPLPYGRGGSPIQNLIVEGFKEAPVCALKMTAELDAGPVYARKNIRLDGNLSQIFERMNDAVNQLILGIIKNTPSPVEQSGEAHIFKRRTMKDNHLPDGLGLEEIYNRIRMLDGEGYPLSYVQSGDIRIEFFSASLAGDELMAQCRIKKPI